MVTVLQGRWWRTFGVAVDSWFEQKKYTIQFYKGDAVAQTKTAAASVDRQTVWIFSNPQAGTRSKRGA
jgi:hypothetical protein